MSSGNHWVRYLIEEASHIATSAVYIDRVPPHLEKPFSWGGYCAEHGYEGNCRYPEEGEPVVLKTHYPQVPATKFDLQPSIQIIRIIRHPIDTFATAGKSEISKRYLKRQTILWRKFQEYWNKQENVLTIRYEDLLNYPEPFFRQIIDAVGYEVSDEDVKRAVDKHPSKGHVLKHLHRYSSENVQFVYSQLQDLMDSYGYSIED